MGDFSARVRTLMKEMESEFLEIFRHCHENPELSGREYETTAYIKEMLTGLGMEVQEVEGLETGVVALLRGGGEGPCIALRADIDALPVREESSSPNPSRRDGVMHACGHDLHYASLLCAAKILVAMREEICGSVKFLFQPAEEVNRGARKMVGLGCLENPRVDAIFGMHNSPQIPQGQVAVINGPIMAGVDTIHLTIRGRGGHGGIPQHNADPVVAAAAVIQSLQTVVSRNLSPMDSGVVSICSIQAGEGTTHNVCPDEVRMYGTVRTYRRETKGLMDRRIHEIVEGVAAAYNTVGEVDYIYELPVTDNTRRPGWPDLLKVANAAVADLGAQAVEAEPSGGGEDFSIFMEDHDGQPGVPGFFYWLGVRNEEQDCIYSWHSPHFKVDPACVPLGAGLYALSALEAIRELGGNG